MTVQPKTCAACAAPLTTRDKRARYCSRVCFYKGNSGQSHPRYSQDMVRVTPLAERQLTCQTCTDVFAPTNHTQKRCQLCVGDPTRGAPLCACGCGEKTQWQRVKGWRKWVGRHHLSVLKPRRTSEYVAWNKGNDARIEGDCALCGKTFKSHDKERKYCSQACRNDRNGGTFLKQGHKDKTAYRFVRDQKKSHIQEHRSVMQEHLGRLLRKSEVVHHIDENGLNNNLANLFLFHCNGCHLRHHRHKWPLQYQYPQCKKD